MRPKRFTEKQIIDILKQAQEGVKIKELCRIHRITDTTFYNWRSRFGGMVASTKHVKCIENKRPLFVDKKSENKPINILSRYLQRFQFGEISEITTETYFGSIMIKTHKAEYS